MFRTWPDALPESIEVCCIQPPGRERRLLEPAFDHVTPLVREALTSLELDGLSRPFALFGHSMGALIAFELSRELRRRAGPQPTHLFLSAYRAPQLEDPLPSICALPDAQFVNEVDRRYGSIPQEVRHNAELLELMLPGLRGDIAVCDSYRHTPEEPLAVPLDVFGGSGDEHVSQEDLAAWSEQTRGPFRLTLLPGDHFFVKTAEADLLRIVGDRLGAGGTE